MRTGAPEKKKSARTVDFLSSLMILREGQFVIVENNVLTQRFGGGLRREQQGIHEIFDVVQGDAIGGISENHVGASRVETEKAERQRFAGAINHSGTKNGDRQFSGPRIFLGEGHGERVGLNFGLRVGVAQIRLIIVGRILVDYLTVARKAIDRDRAGVDDAADILFQRGAKDALGAATIRIEKIGEIAGSFDHSSDVIDNFDTGEGACDRRGIAEIAANNFSAAGGKFIGARGRPSQCTHRNSLGEQTANQCAA